MDRNLYAWACLIGMPHSCPALQAAACGFPECAAICRFGKPYLNEVIAIYNRPYDRVGKPHIKMGGPQ